MRVVIQRVSSAEVAINGVIKSAIKNGLMVLVGITEGDTAEDVQWLAGKIVNLRIFPDENAIMNRSLIDTGGELLLISQFTLYASYKKGNRPSYIQAAHPSIAIPLYNSFIHALEALLGKPIGTGTFGADMQVSLINTGPVTIIMDSKERE